MSAAFTGGPYYANEFTPSTPGNMVQDLADSINSAGWKLFQAVPASASGTISQPTDGITVTLNSIIYTFKNTPTLSHHVQIGVSAIATAANFESVVNTTSTTIVVSFDGISLLTLSYYQGGASGNSVGVSGWITWTAFGGNTTNALWGGGYKFRTSFPTAVPCLVYVSDQFANSPSLSGRTVACIQFMSVDQGIQGTIHLVKSTGQTMRFIGSAAQFFLYNKEVLQSVDGAFVCGGSFYTPAPLPANAWYSFGDCLNFLFGAGNSPRINFGPENVNGASECCYDEHYCGPIGLGSGPGAAMLTSYSTPDAEFEPSSTPQPPRRYGGDPWVSEPFILSGDTSASTTFRMRGQLFDALIVMDTFVTGYKGTTLAESYPWSDGSTRSDGIPRNRLSPDFDNVKQWENITQFYPYGGLFVATNNFVTAQKANYAY